MKIGYGYDFHNLVEGRDLILGGVKVPYYKGLEGYSDADVLTHAICDAILGAMGKGDIGEYFPEGQEIYKDISSIELLKEVLGLLKKERYKIINIDTMIVAEEPKLSPFKKSIKTFLLKILDLEEEQLNIKATTMEGKDSIGRNESIAAQAVILIEKK